MDAPFGVECLTPRTAVVHGAGKPLSDEGTEDENGGHQQKSKNRLSHEHPYIWGRVTRKKYGNGLRVSQLVKLAVYFLKPVNV
jgi:hypothetical protein